MNAFFYLIFLVGLVKSNVCPSTEDVTPCKCRSGSYGFAYITCAGIFSPEELIAPMRAIEKSKVDVKRILLIKDSSLMYLPDGIFNNTGINEVRLLNTELTSLSDSDTAFIGLEEVLFQILASDVEFASRWNFKQLRNVKRLEFIYFNRMFGSSFDHTFPYLPKLHTLYIINGEISHIIDDAFSNLINLIHFYMDDNKITDMKRCMFSNPANWLASIHLSNNSLSYLPSDFFENMPRLRYVYLNLNKFVTLSEKSFSLPLRIVDNLEILDNPLRCDCRMHWLVNSRFPEDFHGKCSTPQNLSGRNITDLDFKSLWC